MSDRPERPEESSPGAAGPQMDDPLASLHKMSRTAGLGSGDYVAVNATAVASLLVGLASVLALLFGTILLIVPLAAVVLSIIAIVQVRRSGGTQSGIGIALLGFLVAMLFVAAVGGKELIHRHQVAREQAQIVDLVHQLGQNLRDRNYAAAWDEFSPRFHERYKRDAFDTTWDFFQANPVVGKITAFEWNGILDVETDEESAPIAVGKIFIDTEKSEPSRYTFTFRKLDDGRWTVDDISGMPFVTQAPAAQQQVQ